MKNIYIKTSAKVDYVPPVWKRAQILGLKEQMRRGSWPCASSPLRRFDFFKLYSPHRLVSRSEKLRERSVQGCDLN